MGTADGMVAQMRKWLGTGERPAGSNYNEIVRRYNREVDAIGSGPWCDMTVTIAGIDSGNSEVVGKFAYTVWHAQWFQKRGQWHYGTKGIRKGDVVFFDWTGTRQIGRIDHVGVVEKVSGSIIYTIEGNIGDQCQRKGRDGTYIVGYGRPAYKGGSGGTSSASKTTEDMVKALPTLARGAKASNEHVQTARGLLLARSHPEIGKIEGPFDAKMERAVEEFQKWAKIEKDGVIGPVTWSHLLRVA